MTRPRTGRLHAFAALVAGLAASMMSGCHLDSYMDPSVQGYWENYPTSMPILTRLEAIESEDQAWANATNVTADDLVPNTLEYRMAPNDFVTVQVFELYSPGQWAARTSRVDAAGFLRVQELGNVQAAGRTADQLQEELVRLYEDIIKFPQVDVEIAEGGGFQYTIDGAVTGVGLYNLRKSSLRLLEALAVAGGVSDVIEHIYIMRSTPLDDSVLPAFERDADPRTPSRVDPTPSGADIEGVIDDFDRRGGGAAPGIVSPGVLRQDGEPAIDIDDLETVRGSGQAPPVDIDAPGSRTRAGWVYDERTGQWVPVDVPGSEAGGTPMTGTGEPPLIADRVIRIPVDKLLAGDSRFNIVIRPDDRIYVEPPDSGFVYLEGQVNRPGPYTIPVDGTYTITRLMAAAGGLGSIAVPRRVDITRMVGPNRQATLRVDLAAIYHRTEPDIVLKPDDHVNVGTDFWATPLAVIRNGFRASYGFGFLLDRNFGNDVFGAPPSNVGNGGG